MSPIESYTREKRKKNGIFYTPKFLAQFLSRKVLGYCDQSNKISSVFDPACGDSILLRSFSNEFGNINANGKLPKIIGVDKDINAIISSTAKFDEKYFKKFNHSFIHNDSINLSTGKFSWDDLRKELGCEPGFSIALSNPPWGADLSSYDFIHLNSSFKLAKGQFDIFDLFIEVMLENLEGNGIYGLILPDSVFSHEHANLRRLITKTTTIHFIARLGEKMFSGINRACVILVGRKKIPLEDHHVDCFRLNPDLKKQVLTSEINLEEVADKFTHKVPQSRFSENINFMFDIDLRTDELKTFDKLKKTKNSFEDIVISFRGAEISKKGIACKCPNCNYWIPFPKSKIPHCQHCGLPIELHTILTEKIVLNHNGKGNIKFKSGEDLFRFTSFSKSWLNTTKKGINFKNLNLYKGDKILVRKTGVGITASIDYEEAITNQVVYILKLRSNFSKIITLEFVLAVLNSRAMTYFLLKKYGETEWKSHPYLTQSILAHLPFPNLDFNSDEQFRLIKQITRIIREEVKNSSDRNITKNNDLIIERIIGKFFHLNKSDYQIIFEALRAAEPLIPIRRLLNCTEHEIFQINGI